MTCGLQDKIFHFMKYRRLYTGNNNGLFIFLYIDHCRVSATPYDPDERSAVV